MKLSDIMRPMLSVVILLGFVSWFPAESNIAWAQSAIEANAQYNIEKSVNFPAELVAILPDGFVKDNHSFGAGLQSNVGFTVHGTKVQNYAGRNAEVYLSYEYRWFNRSDATGNYSYEMYKNNVDNNSEQELEIGSAGEEKGKESLGSGVLSWSKRVSEVFGEPTRFYYSCKWVGQVGDGWLIITIVEIPKSKDQAYEWITKICEKISKLDMHQYLVPVTGFEEE